MCLDFSVCNISKNYTWYIDTWTDSYKISQSGFFFVTRVPPYCIPYFHMCYAPIITT